MKLSPEEKSKIAKKQFENGANPFIDYLTLEQLSSRCKKANKTRVENGTHNFLGKMNPSHERLKNGTHNLQRRPDGSSLASDLMDKGIHNFQINPPHNLDEKTYIFRNLDTGVTVSLTRNEFIKTYDLQSQNVYHMIKGNRKTVKRWALVS